MHSEQTPDPQRLIADALDWWRSAGVDHAFVDDPQIWLAERENQGASQGSAAKAKPVARLAPLPGDAPPATAPSRIGGDTAAWPDNLADFTQWWLNEPSLDSAPPARRVAPSGLAGARLMVLVPMPEEEDVSHGDAPSVLLSGKAGKLLDAMLNAMGLSRDEIYLAAALPARIPAPDWDDLKARGLRDVLLHHIALAAPQRLLILGRGVVSTLAENDPAKNSQNLQVLDQGEQSVPVGTGYDLEAMLARPALKAGVWKKWLEWTAGDGA